jgi:hypothetical protein
MHFFSCASTEAKWRGWEPGEPRTTLRKVFIIVVTEPLDRLTKKTGLLSAQANMLNRNVLVREMSETQRWRNSFSILFQKIGPDDKSNGKEGE